MVTTLSVAVLDEDLGEVDRLTRLLRTELLELDVDRVDLVVDTELPEGAKADPATVTALVVAVTGSPVLVQLGRVLRDWVNRATARKIVVRDGDRSLEITGATAEDNREVIEQFFDRVARSPGDR